MNSIMKCLKQVTLSLTSWMIIFTMVMFPISASMNQAMAADNDSQDAESLDDSSDGEDCSDDKDAKNDDGTTSVYKPGCQFSKDLAKSDLKNHYPDGMKGIIEQFVGAVFAVIGITLINKPIPEALQECPMHMGTKLTFPIVAAGSLSYLIGEVAANIEFKNASKMAVDKSFMMKKDEGAEDKEQAQKNRESNDKQMDAYATLAKIYDKQASGLEKKIMMATLAEAAFITAEVIEVKDMLQSSAQGEAYWTKATTQMKSLQSTLKAQSAILKNCPTFTASLVSYESIEIAYETKKNSKAALDSSKKETSALDDTAEVIVGFENFIASKTGTGKNKVEVAESKTNSTSNSTVENAYKLERGSLLTSLAGTAVTCKAVIKTECATATVGAAVCMAPFLAALELSLTTIQSIEMFRLEPLLCTGADVITTPTSDSPTPQISAIPKKVDQDESANIGVVLKNIKSPRNLFYVKNIISNLFHRIAIHRVESKEFSNPKLRLNEISATSQYAEHMTNVAMDKLLNTDFNKEVNRINSQYHKRDMDLANDFIDLLKLLKGEMIGAAHAGAFKELLNMGIKVGVLYYVLASRLRDYAFPKPKSRAITWAIMAVVNAAILSFDMKSKKAAEDRRDVVLKEASRFAASHSLNTELGLGLEEAKDGSGELRLIEDNSSIGRSGGGGIVACATPKGDSFNPSPCPSILPRNSLALPRFKPITGFKGSLANNSLDLISNSARIAASKGLQGNNNQIRSNLKTLNSNRAALVKSRNALRTKFDSMDLKVKKALQKKTGKRFKSGGSLAGISTKFKAMYSGNAARTGVSPSMLASINDKVKNLENSLGDGKVVSTGTGISFPKFKAPKSKSFDFDMGEGEGGIQIEDGISEKKEEKLESFVINTGEIIDNPDVNLFQVINNRYLRSYSILLEEAPKKPNTTK